MMECEKLIVDNLLKEGAIKFYIRYVDYTLLLVKCQDNDKVLKAFNWFDHNIKFTVDKFENETPHFMDLETCPNGLSIFQKTANTGQYINMDSFILWKWKTAWIRSLADETQNVCSKENFPKELQLIKKFASWNGYP